MKYGKPIHLKDKYFYHIEDEINRIYWKLIYEKLVAVIAEVVGVELRNTRSDLIDAITNGRIWYDDGLFHGDFNAKISKELYDIGATYNPASETFSMPFADVPPEIRIANYHAESRFNNLKKSLIRTLDDIHVESIDKISKIPDRYYQSIEWMNDDWKKTVQAIAIPPDLTDAQRGVLTAEWSQNLDLYIKKWAEGNILKLRDDIQTNAFNGRRSSSLIAHIQHNYDVSKNKAKFLARQETSLLMSKFHETRYKDIGISEYKWSGAMDAREREDHKDLQGQIYTWDSPPIVDRKTGRRANPGEDFGCRCVAIPIIR